MWQDKLYSGTYWPSRKETPTTFVRCAVKVITCATDLVVKGATSDLTLCVIKRRIYVDGGYDFILRNPHISWFKLRRLSNVLSRSFFERCRTDECT